MTSSRLPIGVAQTASGIALRRASSASNATKPAPTSPASGPSSAGTTRTSSRPGEQRLAPHHLARGLEQVLVGGLAPAAADHDRLRVEDVDERAHRRAEPPRDPVQDVERRAGRRPRRARSGRASPPRRRAPRPRPCSRRPRSRRPRCARGRCSAPWHGAAVELDHDVPELGGGADGAAVGAAVEDQPAADAGAEREHDHVLRPAAGADLPFGDRGRVRVVVDARPVREKRSRTGRGTARPASGMFTDWTAWPGPLVDRRGQAEAEGAAPRRRAPTRRGSSSAASSVLLGGRSASAPRAGADDVRRGSTSSAQQLRAAHVDPDDERLRPRRLATIQRRMADGEKPYRRYRGGRARGGVPTLERPAAASTRRRGDASGSAEPGQAEAQAPAPPHARPRDPQRRPAADPADRRLGGRQLARVRPRRRGRRTSASARARARRSSRTRGC